MLLICFIAIPGYAQETKQTKDGKIQGHAGHMAMIKDAKPDQDMNVDVRLHDLELLTQDAKRVKFKSDVIADKLVAMTFIYTSCTTICPVYNAIFTQLQDLLGERLGKDVILVTMTLDPTRDVPRRMKKEAKKFRAKPGWVYLTGKKQNVDQVLRGLDAYFADFVEHPPMTLIGDGKTGTWKRFNGYPGPEHLLTMIDELKAARLAKAE
jgi:protein SCO1/2